MIKNDLHAVKMKQLTNVLAEVASLNDVRDYEASENVIHEAFKQILGLNSELAEKLPVEDVVNFISAYESAEVFKLIILAELYKADGEIHMLQGRIERYLTLSLKSLKVYIKAIEMDKEATFEISSESMDNLLGNINEYEITIEDKINIILYYENCGNFDKAEDILYEVLEDTDNREGLVKMGIAFYNRLINRTEEELENGNLPLQEVEDGLEALKMMCSN